jgi:hypothetical protein
LAITLTLALSLQGEGRILPTQFPEEPLFETLNVILPGIGEHG